METMSFEFEVVTPLFLGGADPNAEAEIRPPSIKGMLRWWFRALGGTKKWENSLFGAAGERDGGRAKFAIKTAKGQDFRVKVPEAELFRNELGYLGYGPIGWKRNKGMINQRPFIRPGSHFIVRFYWSDISEEDANALLLSVWSFVNFGGLGSRNRRGWGSFAVVSYPDKTFLKWSFESSNDFIEYLPEFFKKVQSVFGPLDGGLSEYTKFSKDTVVVIGRERDNWSDALMDIGTKIIKFKNKKFYHDIKHLMEEAEREPEKVSSFMEPTRENIPYETPVPKSIFGLPNNYMSKSRRGNIKRGIRPKYPWQVSVEAVVGKENKDISRRSSPLLISVARLNNGKYSWIATFLPAKFLPSGAKLKLGFPKGGLPNPKKTKDDTLLKLGRILSRKIILADPPSDNCNLLQEFIRELSKEFQVLSLAEVIL